MGRPQDNGPRCAWAPPRRADVRPLLPGWFVLPTGRSGQARRMPDAWAARNCRQTLAVLAGALLSQANPIKRLTKALAAARLASG